MALSTFIVQSGKSVLGASLSFHAFSLRVDNLSNQWMQEESTLVWIPPYSLGFIMRLYGTQVALLLNSAPWGQPQPAPIAGEYTVAVFTDDERTENPGIPVREYSLVQAVSDLTEGAQPANPGTGVDRLWADPNGNIHHLHSNGQDWELVDANNYGTVLLPLMDPHYQALMNATPLGGDLHGTVSNGSVWAHTNPVQLDRMINVQWGANSNEDRIVVWSDANMYFDLATGTYEFRGNGTARLTLDQSGNLTLIGGTAQINGTLRVAGDVHATRGGSPGSGVYYFGDDSHYLYFDATNYNLPSAGLNVGPGGSGMAIQINGYINGGIASSGTLSANIFISGNQYQLSDGSYIFPSGGYIYLRSGSNGIAVQTTAGASAGVNCSALTANPGGVSSQGAVDSASWVRSQSGQLYLTTAGCRIDLGSGQMDYFGQNGGTNHRFFHQDGSWEGTQAANFQVQSSVDHARMYNKEISPIEDSIGKVMALTPVYYYHLDGVSAGTDTLINEDGHYTYGFSARDVAQVLPELVDQDAGMIDYNRMMAVLWDAFKTLYNSMPPGWRP